MSDVVDRIHSESVCRIGEGANCCKYLMGGMEGLECAKSPGNEEFRAAIDLKADMLAQGDNCKGWEQLAIVEADSE